MDWPARESARNAKEENSNRILSADYADFAHKEISNQRNLRLMLLSGIEGARKGESRFPPS